MKYFSFAVVVFAAFVLMGCGEDISTNANQVSAPPVEVSRTEEIKRAEPVVVDLADGMKQLTDSDNGFSVDYPEGFKVSNFWNKGQYVFSSGFITDAGLPRNTIMSVHYLPRDPEDLISNTENLDVFMKESTDEIMVDGYKATKNTYSFTEESREETKSFGVEEGDLNDTIITIEFSDDYSNYTLRLSGNHTDVEIFDRFVNSFKLVKADKSSDL